MKPATRFILKLSLWIGVPAVILGAVLLILTPNDADKAAKQNADSAAQQRLIHDQQQTQHADVLAQVNAFVMLEMRRRLADHEIANPVKHSICKALGDADPWKPMDEGSLPPPRYRCKAVTTDSSEGSQKGYTVDIEVSWPVSPHVVSVTVSN